ncbi:type II secretion system protein [Lapidilactobacillus wuchangensis]|uniref:type II secretion system protein n=1 Tax=Lapidilactobacillus wuchangensis TaxID=2486001 RepID=UPI0013DE3A8E|nr:type II secretion system protein [Lapidilactobacillus wuchangensis]
MLLVNKARRCAGFTLLEMSLVLLIISSGLFVLGTAHTWQPATQLREKLAVQQFRRLYENGMNYSLTHQTGVAIAVHDSQKEVLVSDTAEKWHQQMHYPDSLKFTSQGSTKIQIYAGKVKKPKTLTFTGKSKEYVLTTQFYWGRLRAK